MQEIDLSYKNLIIKDIPELNNRETLYTFDPRSMLDECIGKHRYIVSCENLLTNMLTGQHIAVNQYAIKHTDSSRNQLIIAKISEDPRISIYQRLENITKPAEIKNLYVAVPHPEADDLASNMNWEINYNYKDFLDFNNKISQKHLLGDLTPEWEIIDLSSHKFIENEDVFYKREIGAGGFATFHSSDMSGFKEACIKNPVRWFIEKPIDGEPCSVQIYRYKQGQYTVFGHSLMNILHRRRYGGGLMKKTDTIDNRVKITVNEALKQLDSLLKDYTGFMGLDYIVNENQVLILEANIRATMATFATLQLNESDKEQIEFYRFQ
jgi:hypothetical protein